MNYNNVCLIALTVGLTLVISDSKANEEKNLLCKENSNQVNNLPVKKIPVFNHNKITLVKKDFLFLEGPTWSSQNQAFYFSEMNFNSSQVLGPESTIYQLKLPDQITIYQENSGTNGLLAKEEFLYTMNHANRSLSRITLSSRKSEILVNEYQGLKFNSPNDLVQAADGTLYFTDPNWQLSERLQETPYTGVYAMTNKGKITLIDDSLDRPNGIALSPNQRTLYVGSFTNEIFRYEIDANGTVGKKKLFIKIDSPDGMAIDCVGNLYATSHSQGIIYVYSSEGEQLDKIVVGPKITNIAFGGHDLTTLLITTDHGLYTLKVNIAGLASK